MFRGTVTGYANRTAGIVGINEVVPVNNCLVDEATINGATAVGGAVGYLAGQNIRSITVRSSAVTGSDAYVGGVVGHAYGTSTEIFDCSVENTSVSSTGDATEIYVGGVVGAAQSATESYPALSDATLPAAA